MLDIQNLYKNYGTFLAVNNLNLHINKGELFGFAGHNGAGKTTTMKITVGLLAATGGRIYVDGVDAFADRNRIKRKIGYMPDFFGVYDNLKALEYMEFYASMYGIVGKQARDTCMNLMELVNLADKRDAYVDSLSRGMKQRLCLARSLVHNPQLLLLDEPASGLDPRARFEMKEILKNLSSMGKTIVISSHILPELADMCDTIGIMQRGSMVMYGTMEEIWSRAMQRRPIHIGILEGQEIAERILKENPETGKLSVRENELVVEFDGDERAVARLIQQLIAQEVLVNSFYQEKGNLETVFMQLTDESDEQRGVPQYGAPPQPQGAPQYGAPPQPQGAPQMPPQYGAPPQPQGAPQYGTPPQPQGAPQYGAPPQPQGAPQYGAPPQGGQQQMAPQYGAGFGNGGADNEKA